ncbi:MAG: hypothetical protein ACKKMP_00485 [Candidatus Nealsonbacteria bacterium]
MPIELLLKGDSYILTPSPEITNEDLFPSGVIHDQITRSDKFWAWDFLKNILRGKEKYTDGELFSFSNVSELKTHDSWRGTYTYVVAPIEVAIIPPLDDSIILRNQSEILAFLKCHSEIKNYLSNAKSIIRRHFTEESLEVELVTYFEPEMTTPEKILFLYIVTDLSPQKALEKLEKADKEIFDDLGIDSQFFNINLEFRS